MKRGWIFFPGLGSGDGGEEGGWQDVGARAILGDGSILTWSVTATFIASIP